MNLASQLMFCAALVVLPWTAGTAQDSAPNPAETFNKALKELNTARFLSETELNKLTATWGGGTVKTFTSKKYQRSAKVVLLYRTSGIPSTEHTEVLFFSDSRERKPGWQLVLHYPLVLLETLDVEEKDDGLLLYALRREDGLKIERLFVPYETLVGPVVTDRIAYPLRKADGK